MTPDEIATLMNDTAGQRWGDEAHFQRFARLLLTAEREACAQVCEELRPSKREFDKRYYDACTDCAAIIRGRSNA